MATLAITGAEVANIITALASLVAAVGGVLAWIYTVKGNRKVTTMGAAVDRVEVKAEAVKVATDGMKDALVEAEKMVAESRGRQDMADELEEKAALIAKGRAQATQEIAATAPTTKEVIGPLLGAPEKKG